MCDLGPVMHDLNFRRDDILQNVFLVCSNANYYAIFIGTWAETQGFCRVQNLIS